MGIPLGEGRLFDRRDTRESAPVAIVNETLARRFWPNASAVGKLMLVSRRTHEIAGVVKDGKYLTLGEEPAPFVYLPFEQQGGSGMTVLVKPSAGSGRVPRVGGGGNSALLSRVREEIAALDPMLPLYNVRTMREHLAIALIPAGLGAAVLGVSGGLALLLASVGLYGLLAYAVAQRTHEIGIRRALGAEDADVVGLVLRQAMMPVVAGLAAGTAAAVAVAPVLRSLLYGVGPADPAAHAAALVTLLLTAAAACYVPAYRAVRIEPMAALREE